MMEPSKTTPVANPTWYGQIRYMFTPIDIAHMKGALNLDLSNYDQVVAASADIYGQVSQGFMPRPIPWSSAWVQTFLNWMSAGFPKGVPPAKSPKALAAVSSTATRIRKEITALTTAELDLVKKAFSGMMNLAPTDPNSYFVQAGYHWLPAPMYCVHHAPAYNPWHRCYLMSFENAMRSIPGCENVTLPYYDITQPFPDVLKSAPFDKYTLPQDIGGGYVQGYTTSRFDYPTIAANLLKYGVTAKVNNALSKTNYEDFHGLIEGRPNNAIIAAHDSGHNSIGTTMQDQNVTSFDPVFWFFHANWDRLWWEWQEKMGATTLDGLMSTIETTNCSQTYTVPALQVMPPFTAQNPKLRANLVVDSVNDLSVDYTAPKVKSKVQLLPKAQESTLASKKFHVNVERAAVRVRGLNRLKVAGGFNVHLLKDGKPIASTGFFQPSEVEKCENCVQNAIVHFDFELPLAEIAGGLLSVWLEPINKDLFGDRIPHKLVGNPTIDVHLLMRHE